MYTSTKPTIYLIDGLNLVRSFLYEFARSEEEVTADFLDFLEEMSGDERYRMHTYEVIFFFDDRLLQEDLKRLGVKVQFCRKFYNSFKPREK